MVGRACPPCPTAPRTDGHADPRGASVRVPIHNQGPEGGEDTADDVALAAMAAVTHLRLTAGTTILADGGKHL